MPKPETTRKPCPFCGSTRLVMGTTEFKADGRPAYAVSCTTRGCHGVIFALGYGLFATQEQAVQAWNRRA